MLLRQLINAITYGSSTVTIYRRIIFKILYSNSFDQSLMYNDYGYKYTFDKFSGLRITVVKNIQMPSLAA